MVLTKYWLVGWYEVRQRFQYVWDQVFAGVFIAIILFVFFHIWTVIFSGKSVVEGFSLAQMIWYLAMAETLVIASGFFWIERIGDEVRTGVIASRLLKPMDYVVSAFFINLAHVLYNFVISGSVAFVVSYMLVGFIDFSWHHVLLVLLTVVGGIFLNFFFTAAIGLLSFWVEDTSALFWIYQKAIFILGGMLVPLEVYPAWLSNIVVWLPFSFFTYFPSKLFVMFSTDVFITTIIGQLAWIVVSIMFVVLIYDAGLRKVQMHGG